jgi:ArsR family transcriptional regulator
LRVFGRFFCKKAFILGISRAGKSLLTPEKGYVNICADEHMNNHSYIRQKGECEMPHDHAALLKHIKADMPADELLQDLGDLFKIFGDTTRIKIMYALYEDEMCVCAIADLLGMTQSAISHQLRVLKQARLVNARREGKTVFYSLCDDHVQRIFYCAMEHVME